MAEKEDSSDFDVAAGAVAGAALGAVTGGPIGAIIGGVVGAIGGKVTHEGTKTVKKAISDDKSKK